MGMVSGGACTSRALEAGALSSSCLGTCCRRPASSWTAVEHWRARARAAAHDQPRLRKAFRAPTRSKSICRATLTRLQKL
jgi:hypothetical protein